MFTLGPGFVATEIRHGHCFKTAVRDAPKLLSLVELSALVLFSTQSVTGHSSKPLRKTTPTWLFALEHKIQVQIQVLPLYRCRLYYTSQCLREH